MDVHVYVDDRRQLTVKPTFGLTTVVNRWFEMGANAVVLSPCDRTGYGSHVHSRFDVLNGWGFRE